MAPVPFVSSLTQNNNWIRKKLEDTRNKVVGVFQGPTASTEVYEVFTVYCLCSDPFFVADPRSSRW